MTFKIREHLKILNWLNFLVNCENGWTERCYAQLWLVISEETLDLPRISAFPASLSETGDLLFWLFHHAWLVLSRPLKNSLLVLTLKFLSHVILLLSCALSTGSKSLNASNTSSSHLSPKSSQLLNLHTFITLSLFKVLTALSFCTYPCSATNIILAKNSWLLLLLCFTLSMVSTCCVSLSIWLWYQFLYSWLTCSWLLLSHHSDHP